MPIKKFCDFIYFSYFDDQDRLIQFDCATSSDAASACNYQKLLIKAASLQRERNASKHQLDVPESRRPHPSCDLITFGLLRDRCRPAGGRINIIGGMPNNYGD